MKSIYILKTKGTEKIPDYIQLRDENFVLLTHSRADKPKTAMESIGLGNYFEKINALIKDLPYGKTTKIDL